ncbi:MAG: MGMT family protein [Candidatus Woesearchaeota archaeon]
MATEFQKKVYLLLNKIPKGKVTTYKIIAKELNSRAYMAVGNACKRNPDAPKVPCHRVIKSDGRLGGYAKGSKKKFQLLKKEGIKIKGGKIIDFKKKLCRY